VRTTVDLEEDVLLAAKEIARRRGNTVGQVLSDLARQALTRQTLVSNKHGLPLFPIKPDAGVVTLELLRMPLCAVGPIDHYRWPPLEEQCNLLLPSPSTPRAHPSQSFLKRLAHTTTLHTERKASSPASPRQRLQRQRTWASPPTPILFFFLAVFPQGLLTEIATASV